MQSSIGKEHHEPAGRAKIACINCANAKAGCDKKVPCSRCVERNLSCAARFARRSSKALIRSTRFRSVTPAPQYRGDAVVSNQMVSRATSTEDRPVSSDIGTNHRGQGSPQKEPWHVVPASQFTADIATSSDVSSTISSIDNYAFLNEVFNREASNQEFIWNQFLSELESYPDIGSEIPSYPGKSDAINISGTPSGSDEIISRTTDTPISLPDTSSNAARIGPINLTKITETTLTSTIEGSGMSEFEAIIAAESAWPLARCNFPNFTGTCPQTAVVHLESLQQNSKHETAWKQLERTIEFTTVDCENQISVLPLSSGTRDRMLAITQRFLYIALKNHELTKQPPKDSDIGEFNFLVLPSSKVLEYFLRRHVCYLAPYYALVGKSTLDPNEMVLSSPSSVLLLLLMIAHGATTLETAEARCLAAGLTETCRISLFHIIERDVELSAKAVVLECAWLFTMLGAWSGDARHMNVAMCQRGMYLAMLKHAGFLEPSQLVNGPLNDFSRTKISWTAWREREHKRRLVYNWVSLDLELSLFHDTAPILPITELRTPVPGSDRLWFAKDCMEWFAVLQQTDSGAGWLAPNSLGDLTPRSSMCDLFQQFVHDESSTQQWDLSPLELRLLLYPIQSLACHLRQFAGCFATPFRSHRAIRALVKVSTLVSFEELQSLLQKWYQICTAHSKTDATNPVTQVNFVLYHLVSLTAVTSFLEIERLARKEEFDGSDTELSLRCELCIFQQWDSLFHCGQIVRLIRCTPIGNRPHWWPIALYRVALILWVNSLLYMERKTQGSYDRKVFAIDTPAPDQSLISCLWDAKGIPVLEMGDHSARLDDPNGVLMYFISLLNRGPESRILDGIKRKLQTLSKNWGKEMRGYI
ncbi:hypothetical protein F5884DRAFT_859161 [Xylogone sp. PMI_703]|nr:hypothetical protein F5884DRAFT_859161 [Xylogone sp. PMI_703]